MYRLETGNYRHKQFDISRGSYIASYDDSLSGWYVDHESSDTLDRRGPGFATLREAVEDIDRAIAADLRCPHCDLWIGDPEWAGMASVDHDLSACSEQQWDRARRGDL